MAGMLAAVWRCADGDERRPRTRQEKPKPGDLFSKSREINFLSAARIFLFAARDVWFVVGVPVYLYDQAGWSFNAVAGFMALWVIGYGAVQAGVPKILPGLDGPLAGARAARRWGVALLALPAALAVLLAPGDLGLTLGLEGRETVWLLVAVCWCLEGCSRSIRPSTHT